MDKLFNFFLNFYSFIFFSITIISMFYYNLIVGEHVGRAFLHAYLFWNIGVRGIIASIANMYPPSARVTAKAYNWPEDTLIQRELATNMGSIGILGILCLWFDGYFWLATIIAGTLTCIIAEIGNLTSIFKDKNHPFNKESEKPTYIIKLSLFFGMHLDLIMSCFSLILGLYYLIPSK